MTFEKIYKPIKSVAIKYTYSSSDFEVIDLDLNSSDKYILEEVAVITETIL